MTFSTAVLVSVLCLLVAAILGGLIIYFILHQRIRKQEEAYDQLKKECEKTKNDLTNRLTEKTNLLEASNQEVEALKAALAQEEKEVARLTQELDRAKKDIAARNIKVRALETQLAEKQTELAASVMKVEALSTQIADKDQEIAKLKGQVQTDEKEIKKLKADLAKKEEEIKALAKASESDQAQITEMQKLQGQIGETEKAADQAREEIAQLTSQVNTLHSDQDQLKEQLEKATAQVADKEHEVHTLQQELNHAKAQVQQKDRDLDDCHQQVDTYKAQGNNWQTKVQAQENEIIALKKSLADIQKEEEPKALSKEDKKEQELAKIRERARSFDYSNMGMARKEDRDDLKIISGIGPFIEEKLNALEIYTFDQIARFNEQDIEQVTDAIEFFPGRIQRDHWIDQATELVKQRRAANYQPDKDEEDDEPERTA